MNEIKQSNLDTIQKEYDMIINIIKEKVDGKSFSEAIEIMRKIIDEDKLSVKPKLSFEFGKQVPEASDGIEKQGTLVYCRYAGDLYSAIRYKVSKDKNIKLQYLPFKCGIV